jgi:hypothetical protein
MDDLLTDMEEKKTAFVKLILTIAVIDAAVIIITLILPFVIMGEKAYLDALPLICAPLVICIALSAGYFFYSVHRIDPW